MATDPTPERRADEIMQAAAYDITGPDRPMMEMDRDRLRESIARALAAAEQAAERWALDAYEEGVRLFLHDEPAPPEGADPIATLRREAYQDQRHYWEAAAEGAAAQQALSDAERRSRRCYVSRVGDELAEQHAHDQQAPCPQRREIDGVHALVREAAERRYAGIVEAVRALVKARKQWDDLGKRATIDEDDERACEVQEARAFHCCSEALAALDRAAVPSPDAKKDPPG